LVWGRRATLLLVAFVACGPSVNFAGLKMEEHRTKYHERILLQTLDNGLRLVVVPDNRSNQISVGVNYDVGSSDDPEGADGLAHYAEHVMFYAAYRGADGPALNEVDLYKNAWTLLDRTYFTLSALASELDPVVELTARRFEASCDNLDPATLERERDVVIEEAKLKSFGLDVLDALDAAVWGRGHVYGHSAGGQGFTTVQRPALCKFVADHYGPASAVVVVTGNVSDADFQRIRRRLERIPARQAASRTLVPIAIAPMASARIVLNEIEHPTALLVFPAPGQGGAADAAIDALDGMTWPLERGAPARRATTFVLGEDRQRAIVAVAEVDDAKRLDELSAAMRRSFAKATLPATTFELYQQNRRTALAAKLDDPFASAETIAVAVSRGLTPTRFRALDQLRWLSATDVTRWFDNPSARAAFLLPQIGTHGKAHVAEVATSLHDLDIGHANAASPLLHLPDARPALPLVERTLPNGLRVVLAKDPAALAMDARLVITGTRDPELASDAALMLNAALGLDRDVVEHIRWYNGVAAPVIGHASGDATTFQIGGLTEYADWHVWHLAWTVVHGKYDSQIQDALGELASNTDAKPPGAEEVVARRLGGVARLPDGKRHVPSADALEGFRQAKYRPDRATLIVTGNFDVAAMQKEVDTLFGDWRSDGGAAAAAHPPRVGTAVGIEAPDEATLGFSIAFAPAMPFEDPAARAVLAEMVNDRMRVVRERLGASYGVQVDASKRALWIEGAVEPAYAAQAFKAIAEELARVRENDPAIAEELARAKNHVLARALAMPAAASQRAALLERAAVDGEQIDEQVQAIRGVEVATVQALAVSVIQPARMITAVRGDRKAVEAGLEALGVAKAKIEWIGAAKPNGHDVRPAEMPKVAGVAH